MYCVAGADRCNRVPGRAWGCDANPFMYCVAGAERCVCSADREAGTPGFVGYAGFAAASFVGFADAAGLPDVGCPTGFAPPTGFAGRVRSLPVSAEASLMSGFATLLLP